MNRSMYELLFLFNAGFAAGKHFYGNAVIRQLSGRTSCFQSMKSAEREKTHERMSMQADKVQPCKPENGDRARRSNHYVSITFWCSPPEQCSCIFCRPS